MSSSAASDSDGIPLYLFVSGETPSALSAYGNIHLALEMFGAADFSLEVINVNQYPERAAAHRVLVTPTLIAPSCSRRLIGDLSKWSIVQQFLRSIARPD